MTADADANFDADALERRLLDDSDMSPYAARLVAAELVKSTGVLREQVHRWLTTGETPSMEVAGISIESAIEQGISKNPVSALLLMQDLLDDPDRTKRIIARGHDRIVRRRPPASP